MLVNICSKFSKFGKSAQKVTKRHFSQRTPLTNEQLKEVSDKVCSLKSAESQMRFNHIFLMTSEKAAECCIDEVMWSKKLLRDMEREAQEHIKDVYAKFRRNSYQRLEDFVMCLQED
jgi:hypothetical protein